MLIVVLALQAAAAPSTVPVQHSILAPVANQPCVRPSGKNEVVVCADPLPDQTVPLPDEAVSTRPVPINRDMTGTGALAAQATPCATRVGGCQGGMDILGAATALVHGAQKLIAPGSCCERPGEATNPFMLVGDVVGGAAKATRRKPDKSKRVAIDLDEPVLAGRVHP